MTTEEKKAYMYQREVLKKRRIDKGHFSDDLLKSWDDTRRKLNPDAKLSIAEKELQKGNLE